ncbi:MAG: dTDP-4-dehydrorhamnose 3,5-epimerase [Proteobacteria bacterium]|nr:dTDP-4-dehydrorhamnose 3,5-epimerase [Pseudomonadota bacterium]
MKFLETELPGVIIVEPAVFEDGRGFFMETHHRDKFADAGITATFVQDGHSLSNRHVLRGLHYQDPHPQGKLVRVTSGAIFDVVVDIRVGSPRFGQWVSVDLSEDNKRQIWVPPGFAHGYCVYSETANVIYKLTAVYSAGESRSIRWNDPEIGIVWPTEDPIISDADDTAPLLRDSPTLPRFDEKK